jgi:hypothetical protein
MVPPSMSGSRPTVAQDPGGALTPRVDAAGLPELAASAPWRAMAQVNVRHRNVTESNAVLEC